MRYSVSQWLARIQALLTLHVMRLVDGKVWVVEVPEQGQVRMWLAQQPDSTGGGGTVAKTER
jgi:hypothetical protein